MKAGPIRDWLPPTLGAALMLAGAAGLAYKIISGYQHPAPEAFVSFEDQNKLRAASAADQTAEAPAAPIAADTGRRTEAPDNSACVAIRTEQHEVEGASHKTHSPEEDRFLQRRLVELAAQSVKQNCVE